ncbi:hypothetical protein [Mesoterricola silvestris]|uniref:Lipoprotein n=1 Tax=Mesoterricola silvestris TaxID=2927979 RepID=A0AA48K7T3_9BACT|nr:hypothetical protein [Mesoterricola silvestris]BDU71435.1 hypothetical protein METEAL_06090 [Mesoterricola silvestris]
MKPMHMLLAVPACLLISACGGSTSSAPAAPVTATALAYTDPTPAAGEWALVKDPVSTPTRLVLDLVGPSGFLFRGVGFNLKADTGKVAFSRFQDSKGVSLGFMADKGILHDLDEASHAVPCVASAAGTKNDTLSVGLWQKCQRYEIPPAQYAPQPLGSGVMNEAMDCKSSPVLQVALVLAKDALPGAVTLTVTKAGAVPSEVTKDIPIQAVVKVGTLTLK